jgi:glycosyltransferase involved in cell wall biosynthesis
MKISVGIITFNEAHNIEKAILAIRDVVDEVIVLDSLSTDNTIELAANLGAQVFSEPWKGQGPQKNSLIDKCTGDWILVLDADEVASPSFVKALEDLRMNGSKYNVMRVRLVNYFHNKPFRHGDLGNFYKIILFRKGYGIFDNAIAHQVLQTKEKIGEFAGYLEHHTYRDLTHYIEKLNLHTSDTAATLYQRGKRPSFIKMYFSPFFHFIRSYIIRLGFLDGYNGLLMAICGIYYSYLKQAKLKELTVAKLEK